MTAQILLVEDDQPARDVLTNALEDAGYQVTPARDGETALDHLVQANQHGNPFDVVVTDLRMYSVDGIQVLQEARSQAQPPSVILLTGFGTLETALAAFRNGAYDYLLKPCNPKELLQCVSQAIERRAVEQQWTNGFHLIAQGLAKLQGRGIPGAGTTHSTVNRAISEMPGRYMTVGELSIDRFHHTVTYAGKPLHVTPIEYTLLYCLAEVPGQIVSYRDIVRHTHDQDVDNTEGFLLLKQHVSNLRRKIPADYLVNVRSTGYLLLDPEQAITT